MEDERTLGERTVKTRFEPDRNAIAALMAAFTRIEHETNRPDSSDAGVQTGPSVRPVAKEVTV